MPFDLSFYDPVADGKEIDSVSVRFAKSYCSQRHLVLEYLKCRTLYDFILFAFFVGKVRDVPGDYFVFFLLFFFILLRHRCRDLFLRLLFPIALSHKSYLFFIVFYCNHLWLRICIFIRMSLKKTNALIMRNENLNCMKMCIMISRTTTIATVVVRVVGNVFFPQFLAKFRFRLLYFDHV